MSDQPGDRAIAAAEALRRLASPRSADEAWRVLSELSRLAADLRSANESAASTGSSAQPAWLRPSARLAGRLEPTSARWTSGALFPWTVWDQAAADAFDDELGELDRLAAELISAVEPRTEIEPHRDHAREPGFAAAPEGAPRPRRKPAAWWAPAALGLTAAVAVGVVGIAGVLTEKESSTPTAASAAPVRISGIVHRSAPLSARDRIPVQRKAAVVTAPPRRTVRTGQKAAHLADTTAGPAASGASQLQDGITVAVNQQADQLLRSLLQQAQQREGTPLPGLAHHGVRLPRAPREPGWPG
jgi:hypothetical protein